MADEIYKYGTVNKNLVDSLEKKYLWFSKPQFLNDPFDCNFGAIKDYPLFMSLIKKEDASYAGVLIEYAKKFGICCFTNNKCNLHFWSLYANSHSGICLIFDRDKLNGYFSDKFKASCELQKCDYRDTPIDLDSNGIHWKTYEDGSVQTKPIEGILSDTKDTDTLFKKLILQKNKKIWENEDEERLILAYRTLKNGAEKEFGFNDTGYQVPLQEGSLIGIVLGVKISEDDKKKIYQLNETVYDNKLIISKADINNKNWSVEIPDTCLK